MTHVAADGPQSGEDRRDDSDTPSQPSAPADNRGPFVPVCRPLLPTAAQLDPYLRRIDASRVYSNRGVLVQELEAGLAARFGTSEHATRTAASGTLALQLAILAHAGRAAASDRRQLALMPAFTFAATAHAAEACGYTPVFVDVDRESWSLDLDALRQHPALGRAGLVVAVAAYGKMPGMRDLEAFQEETGIPVVVDAAAGFDAMLGSPRHVSAKVPMALSFHATKSFSTGEGGAVVWDSEAGQLRVLQIANFGFLGTREARSVGLNAKMSEYHAAVGLAMLARLEERLGSLETIVASYSRLAARAGLTGRLHLPPDVSSAYALYEDATAADSRRSEMRLGRANVDTRRWYGEGLQAHAHFRSAQNMQPVEMPAGSAGRADTEDFPNTLDLCGRLLGLPMAPDLAPRDIERVILALSETETRTCLG